MHPEKNVLNVLVVVDMQKDFVDGSLGTPEAQAIVPRVAAKIQAYRQAGGVILVTQDTHGPDYMDTQEGRCLPVLHCVKDTGGWRLDAQVAGALPEDAVFLEKPTFGSTDLISLVGGYVEKYGQENVRIELIGLCTDICVVSNALCLKAFYPELPLSLDASCCAGVTPASHEAALVTMGMCQIRITGRE